MSKVPSLSAFLFPPPTYFLESERKRRTEKELIKSEKETKLKRERERSEMCSLTSPAGEVNQSKRRSKRIKKRKQMESTSMDKSPSNLETSRRQIRRKTKRPKFLSLKLELGTSHEIEESRGTTKSKKKKKKKQKQSKTKGVDTTAFKEKKRAETVGGEKEEEHYDTVAAYLFNSANDSTISSILPYSSSAELDCYRGRNHSPYDRQDHGSSSSSSLLRTAMKKGARKEGETTEERWVSYSEVVDEVVSRSGTPRCCGGDGNEGRSSLALKLDYEQIMEAWLDKGTLYVDGEPPQTVPDLHASTDVSKHLFWLFIIS